MKPVTFFLALLWLPLLAYGQNLVPNADFEIKNGCPQNLNSIPYSAGYNNFPTVADWTNPVKLSSPDYLNTCASSLSGLKVPYSQFGYQQPYTGDAYAGLIAWEGQFANGLMIFDYREYLQVRLTEPLQPGKQYCVSFRVSPSVNTAFNFNYVWLDEIGVNLSQQRPLDSQNYFISLPYHMRNKAGNFLSDSAGWYEVRGNFTATGGEEWLTLGCFKNNNLPPAYIQAVPANPNPSWGCRSYLFIDEVSVTRILSSDTTRFIHDTVVCRATGNNINLSVSPGAEGYLWSNGSQGLSITVQDTGTYWCRSYQRCGLRVDSFHIYYQPLKKLFLGADTVNCTNGPVVIRANHPYQSYAWSGGSTADTLTVYQTGSYALTVADTCGLQKDTVHVTIQAPTPPPVVSDTMICQGVLQPQLNVTGTNLLWYHPGQNSASPVQPGISTSMPGKEYLEVSQTIGKCESQKVPVTIEIRYKPAPDIGDYHYLCAGEDSLIGASYPDVTYLWNTNESVCCIRPRYTGTYELTLSNECGNASDTAYVEISPCDECLVLPNAFTPNGDGRNDLFKPIIQCAIANYILKIYNRWGALVWSSTDPGKGWNGRNEGQIADAGVYIYLMEYQSVNTGSLKRRHGNLTLIK